MLEPTIKKLEHLCNTIPQRLNEFDEQTFSTSPAPNKWSKKEIIGHLIDSATNNHQRFIRVQYENEPTIVYDQNNWVYLNNYYQEDSKQLILFWTVYNKHLVEVIKHIPKENLTRECIVHDNKKVTLQWIIEDYVRHLEHHLGQIFDKAAVGELN